MAKSGNKYLINYKSLLDTFQKESIPNNILLSLKEKVLFDDLLNVICREFIGENFDSRSNLISFNAEDKQIEGVLNECSNMGLFSDRKVVVLKNVKKLLKDAKLALLEYLERPNPDTCLIMVSTDKEFEVEKVLLVETKDDSSYAKENKKNILNKVSIYEVDEFSELDIINWIEEKFEGYKISKDTIKYFLQFTNYSLDEVLSEIEKLKTYCYFSREVTIDSVNLCNGIAKDFNEMDFIKAVVGKQNENALKIYDHISLKKDSEVYLIFLLNSAFITINKLFDPGASRLHGWQLKRELKLWFEDQEKLLPYYKNFKESINTDKLKSAFEYVYTTDKLLKTSGADKRTTMINLINNICKL